MGSGQVVVDRREVGAEPHPAWLFVPPAGVGVAGGQFGTDNLQAGFIPEAAFERSLFLRGIPYSVVHAGFFDAIIPQRTLTPHQTAFG